MLMLMWNIREYGKNASTAYASRMRGNDVPFSKATKTREMVWQRGGMEMG